MEQTHLRTNLLKNHSRLTSTPANDFISPGVGQTTKLYSLYMPITASKPTSTIEKKSDNVQMQEGSGNNVDNIEDKM
jgi:hypothetical protein